MGRNSGSTGLQPVPSISVRCARPALRQDGAEPAPYVIRGCKRVLSTSAEPVLSLPKCSVQALSKGLRYPSIQSCRTTRRRFPLPQERELDT